MKCHIRLNKKDVVVKSSLEEKQKLLTLLDKLNKKLPEFIPEFIDNFTYCCLRHQAKNEK